MNLTLLPNGYTANGIYGEFLDDQGNMQWNTLQHAFPSSDGTFKPAIPPGAYICQRGEHQLEHMLKPFTTFEIMNVPGHTKCLIHMGSFNKDSLGCVLIGYGYDQEMLINSLVSFNQFMAKQEGLAQFTLKVL